jgi:hypothetical protein
VDRRGASEATNVNPRRAATPASIMKDILNKENFTALGIVVVGVIVASMIAPLIQGLIARKKKPTVA